MRLTASPDAPTLQALIANGAATELTDLVAEVRTALTDIAVYGRH